MEKKNNRKILEYFTCENKEHWLREIQKSDWGAGQYLYSLLKENKQMFDGTFDFCMYFIKIQ